MRLTPHFVPRLLAGGVLAALAGLVVSSATAQESGARREFTITASDYTFRPARIEVQQDDLVKIVLRSEDIAHSFTIDEYRIAKRVGAGETIAFEFRADRAGRFRFYCNLKNDERCREMQGELVVRAR